MSPVPRRAGLVLWLLAVALAPASLRAGAPPAGPKSPVVQVWKTPSCGCCGQWVAHMRQAGFTVEVTDLADVAPIKARHGVPRPLASCHTAVVEGYVVEGHVPAEDVRRLLRERPAVAGLSAPDMPPGSPGMDIPGSPPYTVVSFTREGATQAYATHQGP